MQATKSRFEAYKKLSNFYAIDKKIPVSKEFSPGYSEIMRDLFLRWEPTLKKGQRRITFAEFMYLWCDDERDCN